MSIIKLEIRYSSAVPSFSNLFCELGVFEIIMMMIHHYDLIIVSIPIRLLTAHHQHKQLAL